MHKLFCWWYPTTRGLKPPTTVCLPCPQLGPIGFVALRKEDLGRVCSLTRLRTSLNNTGTELTLRWHCKASIMQGHFNSNRFFQLTYILVILLTYSHVIYAFYASYFRYFLRLRVRPLLLEMYRLRQELELLSELHSRRFF